MYLVVNVEYACNKTLLKSADVCNQSSAGCSTIIWIHLIRRCDVKVTQLIDINIYFHASIIIFVHVLIFKKKN